MSDRILVVDDEELMQDLLREMLTKSGFEVAVAGDAEAGLEQLRRESFAVVLLDVRLPGMSGMAALPRILDQDPGMPVILITAQGSREMAVRAIRAGAYDFFEKPFKRDELLIVVRRAMERRALGRERDALAERVAERCSFANIIGESPPMRRVFERVAKVVGSDVTVLIYGGSGTGKELLAEAIHHNSRRRERPFVKFNCVAIPDGLLESELFGHERGAFTGAVAQRKGRFELAHTGTIFLDEIGDMAPGTQAKMLRVLQEREFERVGGSETVPVDVRIIAATNRDLAEAVRDGDFREDLYYRLNEFPICLPPLAERRHDVPLLVAHFVAQFAREEGKPVRGFSDDALRTLLAYDWPGNIRQLRGVVRSAVLLAEDPVIGSECLPPELLTYQPQVPDDVEIEAGETIDDVLERIERRLICDALERAGGVQAQAARLLGCSDRSLWHRVKKLAIDVDAFKPVPARAAPPTPRPVHDEPVHAGG